MIDLSGLRIPLDKLDGTEESELAACRSASARKLHVKQSDIRRISLRRRSIDARKRSCIFVLFSVRLSLRSNERRAAQRAGKAARIVNETPYELPKRQATTVDDRPVVVGAGCAGLFCALALASAGLAPILLERGDDAERRTHKVVRFNDTGMLDEESNIQFGLGGAGTFSDGKLGTGTKSRAHRLILQTLVEAGAQRRILWDAKPHVGSDVLPHIVTSIVEQIKRLGGEVHFRTRVTDLLLRDGHVEGVRLEHDGVESSLTTHNVILACGHSARDVSMLLRDRGISLERKTFAMGVRIEHAQQAIDRALYGSAAGHPALGAASYKLAEHLPSERSVFSFCMCPGGFVVAAASENEGVVTNGMSLSDRAGANANAGLLANVFPNDLEGDDVLAGVELQRRCERKAFELGEGGYVAPAQLVGDFLNKSRSTSPGSVTPTYPRGVTWGSIEDCLPAYIVETLRDAIPRMDRKLHGFSAKDAVLTGVETRSSSPIRITRDKEGRSISTPGLWPCGEGAGYAGGIMSAATDGMRIAEALIRSYVGTTS